MTSKPLATLVLLLALGSTPALAQTVSVIGYGGKTCINWMSMRLNKADLADNSDFGPTVSWVQGYLIGLKDGFDAADPGKAPVAIPGPTVWMPMMDRVCRIDPDHKMTFAAMNLYFEILSVSLRIKR